MTRSFALLTALLLPLSASAAELTITEVSANSTDKDAEKGIVYEASNMLNDNSAEAWIEGEGSAGLGKYFELKFAEEVELAHLKIWAGVFIDKEFWERHNRIKEIELKYPDFSSERITLEDKMEPQLLTLKEPKKLSKVKIYLRGVYDGNTWNATAVTKIQAFDTGGVTGQPVAVKSVKASSTYGDDADYAAGMATDGWLDTWWVEGGDTGDGESLTIEFDGTKTLKKVQLAVGFDATESFFQGSNRAKKATLKFSDGSTKDLTLEDKMGPQTFDLGGVSASSVTVTFGDIVKGKTANDLYVGDVRFWE